MIETAHALGDGGKLQVGETAAYVSPLTSLP